MFGLISKSIGQLSDPRTRGVVWTCIGLALALYLCVVGAISWGLGLLHATDIGWLNDILTILGGAIAIVVGAMFYPPLVTVLLCLFVETLCRQVEERHYPGKAPGRPQPMAEIITGAVNFAGKTIAFNILALLLTFIIPGLNIFVFIAVNGYLISVEYFEMVAVRRMDLKQAQALRKQYSKRLWLAGVVFAVAMSTPIIGLVAPVIAMVYMVHMLETIGTVGTGSPQVESSTQVMKT